MRLQKKVLRIVLCLQLAVLLPVTVVMVWLARQSVLSQATEDGEVIAHLLAHTASFANQLPDQVEDVIGQQMIVEATIAAHLVSIAEKAGMTPSQIWDHLSTICKTSKVFSIVVANETGYCYLNFPGEKFTFSPDPKKQPEAHVFFGLLTGEKKQVVEKAQRRDSDGVFAKYAAVAGIDKPRIVEVGQNADFVASLQEQVGLQRLTDELVAARNILALKVVGQDMGDRAFSVGRGQPISSTLSVRDEQRAKEVLRTGNTQSFVDGDALRVMAPVNEGDKVTGVAIVYLSTAELQASMARQLRVAVIMSLALLLGAYVLAALVVRWISRPIGALREAALKVQARDFNTVVAVKTGDELELLGETFNGMVMEIRAYAANLEEKVQQRTAELQQTLDKLQVEEAKNERLLLNVLPAAIAERLKQSQESIADTFADVTVMFADIVGFTRLSAGISAHGVVQLLNELFSSFDALAEQHGVEKIKTIGDAYMAVAGLPELRADHARAMADMALDMHKVIDKFNQTSPVPVAIRIGMHTGPVVAGVIGTKKFIYDLWGDTVNTASRMESAGVAGAIQITTATRDALGDQYQFEARGLIYVKGKGDMLAWLLLGRRPRDEKAHTVAAEGNL